MVKNRVTRFPANIIKFFTHPQAFILSLYAEPLLEDFFLSAVTSLLAIRLYLQVTGFPQLAAGPLHIAHMLWGGLAMLVALIISLAFADNSARVTTAVLGGVGFGAFIDELGKFITRDNDYFFQPAAAVIYIVFVLMFFAIRALAKGRTLTPEDRLVNAFDIAKQGSLTGLHQEEKARALELLEGYPTGLVHDNLAAILKSATIRPPRRLRITVRLNRKLDLFYDWAAPRWWFSSGIITFFAIAALTSLSAVVAVVEWTLGLRLWVAAGLVMLAGLAWSRRDKTHHISNLILAGIIVIATLISWAMLANLKGMPFSITDWARFVLPGISGILMAAGIMALPRSRLQAYLWFRRAILVTIFLTQVLAFYEQQFLALAGLAVNILILLALRSLIEHEEMGVRKS